jgi:plasmid replication initiation protein
MEELIKQKALEQLGFIKMFLKSIEEDSKQILIDYEVVKTMKAKNPDLTYEDVKEHLINYGYFSGIVELKNQQVLNRHIVLFNEYLILAKALGVELGFSEDDQKMIDNLSDPPTMLFVPTKEGLKYFDEDQMNNLLDKHKERCSEVFFLEASFTNIK